MTPPVSASAPPFPAEEPTPVLPHLASEFLLWFWWVADEGGGTLHLGEELGTVDLWVDTRLAFREPGAARAGTVLTGENPSQALEARAAVAGGKVIHELRVGLRREDREFFATLKAPVLDVSGLKVPQVVEGGEGEEALYDRMFLYEEFFSIVAGCFIVFSARRAADDWEARVVPRIRAWIAEAVEARDRAEQGSSEDLDAPT